MTHIAERAATCTFVTHDHKCSSALTKALANIRTRRFFTDGNEIIAT